jgi:hypothetical protein
MRINTRQTSEPSVLPAPVGGLNGRDPLANMPATDAYLMDNLLPGVASVAIREGSVQVAIGTGGPVQTLATYAGADGDILLAWANSNIWNVTAGGASLDTTVGERAITAMFSNAADNSQHLIAVTGEDLPKHFDGTNVNDLTMTGITDPDTLNFVFTFKERLYFGAAGTLGFYYLPTGNIQGALEFFDLGQVSRKGGYLLAIASYAVNTSGETPEDYIIFITSKGECIVYAGYDPGDITAWLLVGRFFAATPIGPRCCIPYNTDLLILTLEGALPVSFIRQAGDSTGTGVIGSAYGALTSKLGRYLSDLNVHAGDHGWMGITYSPKGLLLLNASTGGDPLTGYTQFVMNTTTNAWSRITGWAGICFEECDGVLYYGSADGNVYRAFEGTRDNSAGGIGDAVTVDVKTAYNYFAEAVGTVFPKHFQWGTLMVNVSAQPVNPVQIAFNTDFKETAQYDADIIFQGDGTTVEAVKVTFNKFGNCASLHLTFDSLSLPDDAFFEWYASQIVFEQTKGVLI